MAENPLVHVPAALPVFQRANALRRQMVGRLRSWDMLRWDDVAYGQDLAQRLQIWELNDLAPRDGWPAVLLLHGGGWIEGSRRDFESMAPLLARRGILAASVDYRLAPAHRWPAQLEDVLSALQFLREQQVDLDRIALWGHSAGGHLAQMVGLLRSEQVRCVVALGAPSDLTNLEGPDQLDLVFGDEDLRAASPVHVECESPPPTLLVHGVADRMVDVEQSRQHARVRPDTVTLWEVPDGDHGLRWPLVQSLRIRRRAVDWLEEQLDLQPRGSKWRRRKKGQR